MPIHVGGYREFLKALAAADPKVRKVVRDELRQAGDHVRRGAQHRFERVDARSAAGYRVRVRQRGVEVEQSLRKVNGLHPDWGRRQMLEALIPSSEAEEPLVARELEAALERIVKRI